MVPTGRCSSTSPIWKIGLFTPGVSHCRSSSPRRYATSSALVCSSAAARSSDLLMAPIVARPRVGYSAIVRGRTDQEGRGGLGLIVLIGVLAVGGYLAWGFVHQDSSVPVVNTSLASDTSAQQKVQAFANAQARAQRTGQAVQVAETFDDAELSSL